ncbi:MAG: FtsW/RodA/SpoVE family cell cycle protein [Patescibacteria group bacterium]|nr:FtsW/RodA/SpoVE family cell cycle protein [Patescibacteria group bacterium]
MKKIIVPLFIISLFSLVTMASISSALFWSQLAWYILGFAIIAFFIFFDWHLLFGYRWLIWGIYLFSILLLVAVYFLPSVRGTHSWIIFGPVHFQPVELAKVALILAYASYFSSRHLKINHLRIIIESFFIALVPAALVFFEPALGSASVLIIIWFGFLLISGLSPKKIIISFLVFAILAIFSWQFMLKDYQKQRVLNFVHPEQNNLTYNYNVIQSKIAIGSAGFFGKGFNQGPQVKLGFLPEPESDFAFAAFMEQWGLLGGLILILAFSYLNFQILKIGEQSNQNFKKFICLGAVIIFSWQFLLNMGSETGILPAVGINFPLLSYGGTSLLTSFFLVAIINAIGREFQT